MDSVKSGSNNIKVGVGEVKTKSLTATVTSAETDLNVSFDHDGELNGNFVNGDTKVQKLSFVIKTTIQTNEGYIAKILDKVQYKFTIGTDLEKLINASDSTGASKYIKSPSFIGTSGTSTATFNWNETANSLTDITKDPDETTFETRSTPDGTSNKVDVTSTFTFEWGDAFLGVNPNQTTIGITDTTGALTRKTLETRLAAFRAAYKTGGEFLSVIVTPVVK